MGLPLGASLAVYNEQIAGTVGLRKVEEGIFEFTKMAVGKDFRKKGIGEALVYSSFKKAEQLGAVKIILYSNKKNEAAIRLYAKIGFTHLPVEQGVYKRANVKMMIDISTAIEASNLYEIKSQLQYQL